MCRMESATHPGLASRSAPRDKSGTATPGNLELHLHCDGLPNCQIAKEPSANPRKNPPPTPSWTFSLTRGRGRVRCTAPPRGQRPRRAKQKIRSIAGRPTRSRRGKATNDRLCEPPKGAGVDIGSASPGLRRGNGADVAFLIRKTESQASPPSQGWASLERR